MQRTLSLLSLLFLFTLSARTQELADYLKYEHILSYHSDIYVQKNCHVKVVETITVYAAGSEIKRGIFRELPTSYLYRGGKVRIGFELLSVKHNGKPEPYHTEDMSNGIRIYAGDADVFVPTGIHTYEFTYDVYHVLGFFDEFDEINWNVNGNGWQFNIDSVSANVYYPEGAELVRYDGYTGKYGVKGKSFVATEIEGGVNYVVTRPLIDHENLTVAVAWNKDQVTYPSTMDEIIFWIQSYILWVIGGLGLLVGFLVNFRTWYKHGRDPKPGTIIPLFYPPTGFSPAECIYLKRGGSKSNTMFGSMLISLAVKGMIEITASGGKGLLSKRSYTIKNLNTDKKKTRKPLTDVEEYFYDRFMGSRSTETITSGKYNSRVQSSNKKLIDKVDSLQKGKYFVRNSHLKARQFIVPAIFMGLGILGFMTYGGSIAVLIVALVLMIIMNVIFGYLYEQPTTEGRKKMDEIAGFEMYMKYADRERIRLQNPPTMNFEHYEENLAYAIALGVAKEWAGQFDPIELEDGVHHHMPYMAGLMVSDFHSLGSDLSHTISSAATPPSSSGSASGGGGFSGGGGGGGGGGGW